MRILYITGERGSRDWWTGIFIWLATASMVVVSIFAFSVFFLLSLALLPLAALILWLYFRRINKILRSADPLNPGSTSYVRNTNRQSFQETVIEDIDDENGDNESL